MTPAGSPVTQDALNRLEDTVRRELVAHDKLDDQRFNEHERRIGELNDSHKIAAEEKRHTDEAATKIAERSVTKDDLNAWRREVDAKLAVQAGTAPASTRFWSVASGAVVTVITSLIVFYLTRVAKN
jgi:Flp pilus assembly protein TadB